MVEAKVKVGDSVPAGRRRLPTSPATAPRAGPVHRRSARSNGRSPTQPGAAAAVLANAGAFTQKQVETPARPTGRARIDRAAAEAAAARPRTARRPAKSELARKKRLVEAARARSRSRTRRTTLRGQGRQARCRRVAYSRKADWTGCSGSTSAALSRRKRSTTARPTRGEEGRCRPRAVRVDIAETALKREQETAKAAVEETLGPIGL